MNATSAGPPPGVGPDHRGDGDGWVECAQGHRHWGRFGAAGLLTHRTTDDGTLQVLLQHRVEWSHHGGTWGVLGGARASTESARHAALREAAEEGSVDRDAVRVEGRYDDEHGGWSYVTVLAAAGPDLAPRATGRESLAVRWHPADQLTELPLHPGFAQSWPLLRPVLGPVDVVVDVANVMGSRPDGWWRDRRGAMRSLAAQLAAWADGRDVIVVFDGRPYDIEATGVEIRFASRRGQNAADDDIVALVEADTAPEELRVVTSDGDLARRIGELGAEAVGAGGFRRLLDSI